MRRKEKVDDDKIRLLQLKFWLSISLTLLCWCKVSLELSSKDPPSHTHTHTHTPTPMHTFEHNPHTNKTLVHVTYYLDAVCNTLRASSVLILICLYSVLYVYTATAVRVNATVERYEGLYSDFQGLQDSAEGISRDVENLRSRTGSCNFVVCYYFPKEKGVPTPFCTHMCTLNFPQNWVY